METGAIGRLAVQDRSDDGCDLSTGRGCSWLGCHSPLCLLGASSTTYKTSPALSSLVAAMIVQAFSTVARYSLEDEALSNVAGGHSEGNIQSPVS